MYDQCQCDAPYHSISFEACESKDSRKIGFSYFHAQESFTWRKTWVSLVLSKQWRIERLTSHAVFSVRLIIAIRVGFNEPHMAFHLSPNWFHWYKLLMTSGPALSKSNGCSGLSLAWRSRRTEDIFRCQFGDSAAIYWPIERLMSVCFWYVAPCVCEPQSDEKTGLLKYQ